MKKLIPLLACIAAAGSLYAVEGDVLVRLTGENHLVPLGPPGAPYGESPSLFFHGEAGISHRTFFTDSLWLNSLFWVSVDSNPGKNPLGTPGSKQDIRSRILEFQLAAEVMPAQLILEAGKRTLRPSLGFFKTPLNLVPELPSGGLPGEGFESQWAEGGWGIGWMAFLGDFTVLQYFLPRLVVPETPGEFTGRYLFSNQPLWTNYFQAGGRIGDAEFRGVYTLWAEDPLVPEGYKQAIGGSLVTNWGEALLVRAEGVLRSGLTRQVVEDPAGMTTAVQKIDWGGEAILGMTWTSETGLSVLGEYWFQHQGFSGTNYTALMDYTRQVRHPAPGHPEHALLPDLADQFGMFNSGMHYLFFRLGGEMGEGVSGDLWTRLNLQDLSGLSGATVSTSLGGPSLVISCLLLHGDREVSEAGLSSLHWRTNMELRWRFQ